MIGSISAVTSNAENRSIRSTSPRADAYPRPVRIAKRSRCAKPSSKVPELSCGFIVPTAKNGRGRACRCLPAVTTRSSIAASSADCTRWVARLNSSKTTALAKIGPTLERLVAEPVAGDQAADDVLGRQVARALDARVVAADGARDDAGERRLADARARPRSAGGRRRAGRRSRAARAARSRPSRRARLRARHAPDRVRASVRVLGARRAASSGISVAWTRPESLPRKG